MADLLAPLRLPSRAVGDLEALGDAARGLPALENALGQLGCDSRHARIEPRHVPLVTQDVPEPSQGL